MDKKWMPNQQRALDERDNLIISASAGSGKTTVLIEKIFRVLMQGGSLRNMAVMTFTDLAAAELKDRLSDKLLQEIRKGAEVERLREELEYVAFADVSTIHAFCKRLYKKYYAEIGEDYFEDTLNGDEAASLFFSCAEKAIAEKRSESDSVDFDKMFWHFYGKDRGGKRLVNAIIDLHAFLDCVENREDFIKKAIDATTLPFLQRSYAKLYFADFIAKAAKLNNKLSEIELCLRTDPGYQNNTAFLSTMAVSLVSFTSAEDYKDLLQKAVTAKNVGLPNLQRAKIIDKALLDMLDRLRESYKYLLSNIITELGDFQNKIEMDIEAGTYVKQLLGVTKLAEDIYEQCKKKDGMLDFSDLEKMALKVLEDESRLEEVSLSYTHVFLDEYQDTNYLQNKILSSISKKAKVFVVGDVKQSIYQFRYAEPDIFLKRFDQYEAGNGGVSIPFNDNFRSDKNILDFVNEVFSEVMTLDFGGIDYRNKAQFMSGLGEFSTVNQFKPVEIAVFSKDAKGESTLSTDFYDIQNDDNFVEEGRDKEAEYISNTIKTFVKGEVYDVKLGKARKAKLEDVAILVNTHNQAKKMSKTLTKMGVANYVYSGGEDALYSSDRDFIFAYLRLLCSIHDDNNLAVVLLSPLTAFSTQDLVDIRIKEDKQPFWVSFLTYRGAQNIKFKIDSFMSYVEKHRLLAASTNVKNLIMAIIKDFKYDAYVMGSENGDERIQSINVFLESLNNLAAAQDLNRFVQYLDSGAKWNITPPASGGDNVSIMTIHASKGLEFPFVFIPYADYEFSSKGQNKDKDFLIVDRDFGIALDYYDEQKKLKHRTIAGKFLEGRKRKKELEEKIRLMYVAMTRAKNHLVITMKDKSLKKAFAEEHASFAKWLNFARLENVRLQKYFVEKDEVQVNDNKNLLTEKPYSLNFDILKDPYKYKEGTTKEVKYTVTALTEDGGQSARINYFDQEDSEKMRLTGVAYHSVLERLDFYRTQPKDILDIVDALVMENEITKEIAAEIDVNNLSTILNNGVFEYARKGKSQRELGFMLYLPLNEIDKDSQSTDKVLVQGVIDLLIRGEKNILVDYKYSSLSGKNLAEKYQKQVSIYKLAVEKLMKIKIDKTIIIALKGGQIVEID